MERPKLVSPAEHGRAADSIRRVKAWCGLAGFAVTGFAAHAHGDLLFTAGVRALEGGVVGYLLGWLAAVTAWRRIMQAEAKRIVELAQARRQGAE
jgi:hypothetical protein